MATRLKTNATIGADLQRLIQVQLERAIDEARDPQRDWNELIHGLRLRCKRIVAMLLLMREADRDWNDRERKMIHQAASNLGRFRDAHSIHHAFQQLCKSTKVPPAALAKSVKLLCENVGEQPVDAKLENVPREQLQELQDFEYALRGILKRLASWPMENVHLETVIGGLVRTYKRGRGTMRRTRKHPTDDNLHHWRKWAKHHQYQLQLLKKQYPQRFLARSDRLSTLTKLLGDDHDLAMLRRALAGHSDDAGVAQELVTALVEQRGSLQANARKLGQRIFEKKPKQFKKIALKSWRPRISQDR